MVTQTARSRVARLEQALKVLGEANSTKVRGLQAVLKEARRVAQDRPVAAQIEEWEAFIHRSWKRLDRLEEERLKEQQELDAALARIARVRGHGSPSRSTVGSDSTQQASIPDLVVEIDWLRASQRDGCGGGMEETFQVSFSPDLVAGPDVTLPEWGALHDHQVGQDKGAIMETLIQRVFDGHKFQPVLTNPRSTHHRVCTAKRWSPRCESGRGEPSGSTPVDGDFQSAIETHSSHIGGCGRAHTLGKCSRVLSWVERVRIDCELRGAFCSDGC